MRRAAPQQWSVTALLSALLAIPPLSTDISLPALPSIAGAFREDAGRGQLVVALFLVGFAVGQLGYGPASDRFGRRPVLIGSLGLYFVASVGCLVAPSLEWLGAARLIQGLGACGGPVIARAVVRDVYEPVRGARVLALASLGMAAAPLVGAIAGGVIVLAFHWRGVFVVLAGFGALLMISAALLLPETKVATPSTRFSLTALARTYSAIATDRPFLGYILTLAGGSIGLFAWLMGSPFVLMTLRGLPPHLYGLAFAAVNIGTVCGAIVSARLVVPFGIDRTVTIGLTLYLAGAAALVILLLAGVRHAGAVIVPMALFQFGNGMVMPNTVAGAMAPFPQAAGSASALAGFAQMATGALSGLVLGRLHDGSARPMTLLVAASAVSAALFFALPLRRRRERQS
jgi:DHA1 family bicyclomycin/chloramphenicol resistance-like MFS transporter